MSVLKENQTGCFEVEQTMNQLLQRTMQLIIQIRTIEFPLDYSIPRTPRVPINRPVPRDMLHYRLVVLIVARTI